MSQLTLPTLMSTTSCQFTTAADTWRALADVFDAAAEDLTPVERGLPEAWESGSGSQECLNTITALRGEVDAAYVPCGNIASALENHGYAVDTLRSTAQGIIDEAVALGFAVDQAACLVDPTPALVEVSDPEFDRLGQAVANEVRRQQASDLTTQLADVLNRARTLDDDTVATINTNLPDPTTGFTAQCLIPPSRDEVAAIADQDPKTINDWWRSQSPSQQETLIQNYPDLIGWMDGIPCADRDTANRLSLANQRRDLEQEATDLNEQIQETVNSGYYDDYLCQATQDRLDQVNTALAGLTEVEETLAELGDQGLLLGIDPTGDGKAIIAVGNPDTADNVVTYVPGTGSDLSNIDSDMNRTQTMVNDANGLCPDEQTAGIFWLGYDAPDAVVPNAGSDSYADNAVDDLSDFQSGLRLTHEGGTPSHNVILGHSYGTTVIGYAASQAGLDVDEIVLVASPGVGVDSADDLGIPANHVWATTAANDAIAWVAYPGLVFGEDPTSGDFGANVFASDPEESVSSFEAHSNYWDDLNIARDNIAQIVVDGSIVNEAR